MTLLCWLGIKQSIYLPIFLWQSKYNTQSLTYAIVQGPVNTAQTQFFSIDPSTGVIRLRQRVNNAAATSYQVNLPPVLKPCLDWGQLSSHDNYL